MGAGDGGQIPRASPRILPAAPDAAAAHGELPGLPARRRDLLAGRHRLRLRMQLPRCARRGPQREHQLPRRRSAHGHSRGGGTRTQARATGRFLRNLREHGGRHARRARPLRRAPRGSALTRTSQRVTWAAIVVGAIIRRASDAKRINGHYHSDTEGHFYCKRLCPFESLVRRNFLMKWISVLLVAVMAMIPSATLWP